MTGPDQDAERDVPPTVMDREVAGPSARRLTLGSGINLLARVVSALLGVGVAALLSRELGPSGYGTFTTALGLVTIATAFTDFGTNAVAVKEMSGDPSRRDTVAGGLLAARAILAVGLLVPLCVSVVLVLPEGAPRAAGLIVAATIVLGVVAALQSVVQADLRPELVGLLVLAQGVSWFGAVVVVAQLDGGVVGMAVAFAVTSALQAALTAVVVRRHLRIKFDGWFGEGRRLLRIALPLGVAGMLTTAYYRVDAILVYELAGDRDAAFYNAAYRFIDTLQIVPGTLFGVLFPLVATRLARGKDVQAVFTLALMVLLSTAVPLVVGGALLARPIVRLVFSSEFDPAAPLLAILLFAFLSICLGYLWSGLLLADGPLRTFTLVAAVAAIVSLTANAVAIPFWGATAAAWVTLGTEWCVSSTIGIICLRHHRLTLPGQRLFKLGLAGIALAGALLALRDQGLLVAVVLGGSVYLATLLGTGAMTRADLSALVGKRGVLG